MDILGRTQVNCESLRASLQAAGVADDEYLIGGSWDDRICLVYDEEQHLWQVYGFERGNKIMLRQFDNEEAACYHLYARLINRM